MPDDPRVMLITGARKGIGRSLVEYYAHRDFRVVGCSRGACEFDEKAQACGNGNMVAIPGGSREGVDKLYAKAIELGATDEGPPGERMPVFYGGYVRDLDGNKLCFFEMSAG